MALQLFPHFPLPQSFLPQHTKNIHTERLEDWCQTEQGVWLPFWQTRVFWQVVDIVENFINFFFAVFLIKKLRIIQKKARHLKNVKQMLLLREYITTFLTLQLTSKGKDKLKTHLCS